MKKRILTGLLCIVLLLANTNALGMQVLASETEQTTGGGYGKDASAKSDEIEKELEVSSNFEITETENEVSKVKELVEEGDVDGTEVSEVELNGTRGEEETDVKDNEIVAEKEDANRFEEDHAEYKIEKAEKESELIDLEDNTVIAYTTGMPYLKTGDGYQYDVNVPHIVINQVYGDGGKKSVCVSHDFVELYNPTDNDIDLSGWSVQYRSSAEGGTDAWSMHKLSGTIKSHHSYLIRCGENSNFASEYFNIVDYDEEWDQQFYNKGLSVALLASQLEIASSDVVFDNAKGKPALEGYIDMFAVSGDDGTDSQKALYYEEASSDVQSKNKTARRNRFADTDDNSTDGDFECVDYSFQNDDYIHWISPRSSADGEWDEKTNARPTFTVIYESNGGTEVGQETYGLGMEVTEPETPEKEGYIFVGWYEDAALTKLYDFSAWSTGDITLYAKWKEERDKDIEAFPSVHITTDNNVGNSLNKNMGYVSATITVGEGINEDGKIKVRGNSTAVASKKPYTIKFSQKQDVFGMGSAKKWVLLANCFDPTLMRNYLAFSMAYILQLDYTPEVQYVDLYLDDVYKGNYLLTEAVEVDSERIDIDSTRGDFLIEYEMERYESGVTYIRTPIYNYRFIMHEPEILTDKQRSEIMSKLSEIETAMESCDFRQVVKYVDVDSFVDFYILNEFMKPVDINYSSVYFYYKKGKLYAGPVWDYDLSSGNASVKMYESSVSSYEGIFAQVHWLGKMAQYDEFMQLVKYRYNDLQSYIKDLYLENGFLDRTYDTYNDSFERNFSDAGWNVAKLYSVYMRTPDSTYTENFEYLREWIKKRNEWICTYWKVEDINLDYSEYYHAVAKAMEYSEEYYGNYEDLESALLIDVYKEGITQEDIDTAAQAILTAIENLIYFADIVGIPYSEYDGMCQYDVSVPHIIINQIYGADNDGYCSHSFIELYNPTNEDVSLDGWSLYYQSAPGGNYSGEWEKLELQGKISAYSSYLVRAKQVTNNANVVYEVPKGDAEWNNLQMYNKGGTVLLSCRHDDISQSDSIYDNDRKIPLIKGYVDMLSVSGNDTDTAENIAKEAASYSEGTASRIQSNKKAIRRIAFTDTDNNSVEDGDCEVIDYTLEASKYIEWAAPRNLEYGEWYASNVPMYTVTLYRNDGTDSCETIEIAYTEKVTGLTVPVREGYIFSGWYQDSECEMQYDFDEMPVNDIVLYAGWYIVPEGMCIEGIIDDSLSQSVNTIKEYKIRLQPKDTPFSDIAIETNGSSAIKIGLENDTLKINMADAVVGDSLLVKFYIKKISTDNERIYINGGNFTINAIDPVLFMNSVPEVSVKGADDVSVTLCVCASQEIENFVNGKLYYKLEAIPYMDAEKEIPNKIKSATSHPAYVSATGETQQVELIVNDAEYGKGQNWKFDVKVSLLLAMDEALPSDSDFTKKILYESKANCLTNIETRENNVEDSGISFDLQERNTIIYTGQSNLVAAEVLWNEINVINELGELRDITAIGRGTTGSSLTVFEEDGKIMISAPKGTEPGVHTIEAVSYGPDKIYKVRRTMSVVVLKGIEALEISVPSTRIYKQNGRQIQINTALRYNDGGTEPKLKKVVWQVMDAEGNLLDSSSPLYDMIKINNGKLTVDKNLVLAKKTEKNCFRIMVHADDYNENEVYALSDVIEISDSKLTIGNIVLLRYNSQNETYETIDVDRQLTADIIGNAVVVSLAADAPNKRSYTFDELQQYQVPCSAVQYKLSSNKMSIAISDDGAKLHAGQVVGKVTLTATAADGGKQKASVKLNLTYAQPVEMAVAMQYKRGAFLGKVDAKEVSFAGTTNTAICLQVNAKSSTESEWEPLWAHTNYTLKVSGAKILESDSLKGRYDIIVTGEKATITLNDKVNKVKKIYTLTNYAYSKLAAPKVKQEGTLETGSLKGRSITFKLNGNYDYTGKSVLIETDATQKTLKNKKAYYYTNLEKSSMSFGECNTVSPDGSITLNFDSTFIYASNYKLKMTFGVIDENGIFIADAKPVSQTLKVKVPKTVKGSFKLITSYKLKADAGEKVLLTGTGKEIKAYNIRKMTNAIGIGTENKFTDYFQISDNQLCFKANLNESDIEYLKSKAGKKHLSGYVTYTAYHGDNGYGEPYVTSKTVKITVKLTDL